MVKNFHFFPIFCNFSSFFANFCAKTAKFFEKVPISVKKFQILSIFCQFLNINFKNLQFSCNFSQFLAHKPLACLCVHTVGYVALCLHECPHVTYVVPSCTCAYARCTCAYLRCMPVYMPALPIDSLRNYREMLHFSSFFANFLQIFFIFC
jgi:hypothetical protein